MRFRLFFLLVTAFFVTMNVLLWQSEVTRHHEILGRVPTDVVWQKVLTAPDNSRLAIEHNGVKIGYCTWAANVGEELATGKVMAEELPPEGMVKKLSGYTLDLDGSVSLEDLTRVRFTVHLTFTTNQALKEIFVSLKMRPDVYEVRSVLAEQTLSFMKEVEGRRTHKLYRLSEPQHLEQLLGDLGLPVPPGTLAVLGIRSDQTHFNPAALGLLWAAHNDWLQFGHAHIRAYRLEASLLGHYQTLIYVSHIGEILRVELPEHLTLRNDALTGLRAQSDE